MKRILSILLILVSFNAKAQEYNPWYGQQFTIAVNAEQMIEKVGFDKLMEVMFKERYSKYSDESDAKQKVEARKALAAMYGAGIDFSRKIWMITFSNEKNEPQYDYDMPSFAFIIPIKNKEVFKDAMHQLMGDNEYRKPKIVEKGEDTYYFDEETFYVLNNKEFIIGPMKDFYRRYDYNSIEGTIIKTDTIAADKNIEWEKPKEDPMDKVTGSEKKSIKEVDRWENGKITRVYQYVEKKYDYPSDIMNDAKTPYPISDTPVSVIVEAPKAKTVKKTTTTKKINGKVVKVKEVEVFEEKVPEPPMEMKIVEEATPATPAAAAEMPAPKQDAIEVGRITDHSVTKDRNYTEETRTIYLEDGRRVTVTYIPYNEKQRDSVNVVKEEIRAEKKQQFAQSIFDNYKNLLVYNNTSDPDLNKIIESKEDVAMLSSMYFGNMFLRGQFFAYNLLHGTVPKEDGFKSLTFLNFENGKATAKFQTGCCNQASTKINEMYQPITNFWPKEMGVNSLMTVRYNVNPTAVMNYYKSVLPKQVFDEGTNEMAKEGISWDDWANVLTGEIAMTVESIKSKSRYDKDRNEPKMVMALKLKDPKRAVEMMNIVSNKSDFEPSQYYRFDENGQYIYFNTDKVITASKANTNPAQPNTTLNFGHFGEIKVDVKGMIQAFAYREMKNEPVEFALLKAFFNKVYSVNNKSEDGQFVSEINADLGNPAKNALANLLDLTDEMAKANEARRKQRDAEYEKERSQYSQKQKGRTTTTKKATIKKK